ncbi:MAG: 2OG-Fe(II) oxygenase [Bacteriovoracaceae bacterium]|jgi:hypothetical protein|nr:2OG-Fe(II) oxygenase [Bacteriovoracaceae bacterium]
MYINEFPKIIDQALCQKLIDFRNDKKPDSFGDLSWWDDQAESEDFLLKAKEVNEFIRPCISKYLESFGGHLSPIDIHLKGFGLIRQPIGAHDSIHFDTDIIFNEDNIKVRPFVCILYLNDKEFSGGQLIFPVQKEVIEPELGKIVIFPASYMFPHQVAPIALGERYYMRLNYMFSESLFDKDKDEFDIEKEGAQIFL